MGSSSIETMRKAIINSCALIILLPENYLRSQSLLRSPHRSPEPAERSLDLEIHRRCFSAVLFYLILDLLPSLVLSPARSTAEI